jgi:uncharacterized protein with PQ loop repeat
MLLFYPCTPFFSEIWIQIMIRSCSSCKYKIKFTEEMLHYFCGHIIDVLYILSFILGGTISAITQLIPLVRTKDASELSLITFLGFNYIQIVSAAHAYLHQEMLFLLGMLLLLALYGTLSGLIMIYKFSSNTCNILS